MTTCTEANVHAIAIDGNFDDCQRLVKGLFNHHAFRDRVGLSGVNSINWGRIMAQIVYYFSAALSLGAPDRPVSFVVPHRQFRRHLRRPCREDDGAADRAAGHRHQRKRHPGPRAGERSLRDPRGRGHHLAVDGQSRSRPISNGCCSRRAGAMPRRCASGWTGCPSPAPSPSTGRRWKRSAPASRQAAPIGRRQRT